MISCFEIYLTILLYFIKINFANIGNQPFRPVTRMKLKTLKDFCNRYLVPFEFE